MKTTKSIKRLGHTRKKVKRRRDGVKQAYWVGRKTKAKRGLKKLGYRALKRKGWKGRRFTDTDGDGRVNVFDCKPLNPLKQGEFSGSYMNGSAYISMKKGRFDVVTDWFSFDDQTLFDLAVYFRELFDDKEFMKDFKPHLKESIIVMKRDKTPTITRKIQDDLTMHIESEIEEEKDRGEDLGWSDKKLENFEKKAYGIDIDKIIRESYNNAKKEFIKKIHRGLSYTLENPMENEWTQSRNWYDSVMFNSLTILNDRIRMV